MTCGTGREEVVVRNRLIQASQGVNTCLPEDSGAQSISSGLITKCSNSKVIGSVFALQVWKGLCYLYGLILEIQASSMRTPGTASIAVGVGAGTGATASISGNDTAGQITVTTGTGTIQGLMATLAFPTPYTSKGILHLEAGNDIAAATVTSLLNTTASVSGATVNAGSGILNASTTYIWNYVILGGT